MMNDLISRQAVKEWLERWEGYLDKDMIARMQLKVDDIPTHKIPSNVLDALDCVERQAAIEAIESLDWYHQNRNKDMVSGANSHLHQPWYKSQDIYDALEKLPSVQPKTQKLLDDGTLIVHTDIDITKITRVNITQNNTHYGDLFYRDEE